MDFRCPKCDSVNLKKNGFDGKKQIWKCKNCNHSTVNPSQYIDKLTIKNDQVKFTERGNSLEVEAKIPQIKTLDEIIKHCDIDLNVWKIDSHVINKWDSTFHGSPIPLFQVKVFLSKKIPDVETFPTIKSLNINVSKFINKKAITKDREFKTALVFPDAQVGFRKDLRTNRLDPFHDRRCMDIGLQISSILNPDVIILQGDMIDLPEQSDKFLKSPEFYFTTQPAIIELGWWIAQIRNLNPNARIIYLEGNHEFRLKRSLMTNLIHSYNLKSYDKLDSYPALSIENLLSLDKLNVEYLGDYPKGEFWLNDNLKGIHGNIAKSGSGDTVKEVLKQTRCSLFQGHIHRIESASKTVHVKDRSITYRVDSFGCFCRIDGVVPSHGGKENWQQGFGTYEYEIDGDGLFQPQSYSINDGAVLFRGELVEAREEYYLNKLKMDTGWEF